ncbi:methyltransferase domain-containing protein [Mycobacterium sp.]|uniref:methyltransferase domain-containing protein n=1 Tax=Mycobacterium sp. TaxID=1785 RepID=UPI00127766E6|nr:methyltransferase domain-containing protein [Mycobacterium sp.]KAA8967308.1 MAG: methyltransferase domain-containing protein [Mycobacterium sp.]
MTESTGALPAALQRALELLTDPPAHPDAGKGYLDLLGSAGDAAVPKNTGPLQAIFLSRAGATLYDYNQAVLRRVFTTWLNPTDWLAIPPGGVALDVGCGPGSVTAALGRAVGPDGLALGVDISETMLARAVRAAPGPQVGFLRADAQRLPLRDATVDAVACVAVLQLVPDPAAALAEMARVLRPGGRLAVMVPVAARRAWWSRALPQSWGHVFGEDEIPDVLRHHGLSVHTRSFGTFQSVRAERG